MKFETRKVPVTFFKLGDAKTLTPQELAEAGWHGPGIPEIERPVFTEEEQEAREQAYVEKMAASWTKEEAQATLDKNNPVACACLGGLGRSQPCHCVLRWRAIKLAAERS